MNHWPADQPDQQHGDGQAAQEHQEPQQPVPELRQDRNPVNDAKERQQQNNNRDDEQREKRRKDIGFPARQREAHGLAEPDLLVAGDLHRSNTCDGSAKNGPNPNRPNDEHQEIQLFGKSRGRVQEILDRAE